uniref:Uncharacterized protein n=1 Tax=Branchiostoma floridae TaxID=7739 RepID=C3ZTU6_BRAFL|eukprot:XP_002588083.1 hypothetical protein BRAFLDRAFT_83084 [Branchiostoma floridae]
MSVRSFLLIYDNPVPGLCQTSHVVTACPSLPLHTSAHQTGLSFCFSSAGSEAHETRSPVFEFWSGISPFPRWRSPKFAQSARCQSGVIEGRMVVASLKRDSKAKELANGLWSEASEKERAPTARDLRVDDDLADRVDKTLDEIFGKKPRTRSSSRRKDRKDTSPSPSLSRSPDAARSRRRLKNVDSLLGKRPVSSRKRSSFDSTTSSSRSRSPAGSRSRRRHSNDHKGHRRRHRSAHRRRHSSGSRSSSSPRRRRRGKKSGRTKTINDSASTRSDAWKRNIPKQSAVMGDPFVSPLVTTQGEPPVSLHSRVPLAPGEDIIELYTAVAQTGVPNYIGARIPVNTSLNIPVWRDLLANYSNTSLPDFLEFGWPINIHPENYNFPHNVHHSNHRSALDYQADVDLFIDKELRYGAMCGPFRANPFPFPVFPAPLQTVAKRDSATRRVVVDLSYPSGQSVNDAIPKNTFLGEPISLVYSSVDTMTEMILDKGRGCNFVH